MGIGAIDNDTVSCPPPDGCGPESGERLAVSTRLRNSDPAPRYVRELEVELSACLAGLRCPQHDQTAVAELSVAEDATVQIIPIGCCGQLDDLVLNAVRESVPLGLFCLPGLRTPRTPR
jgi:hypothetical protein